MFYTFPKLSANDVTMKGSLRFQAPQKPATVKGVQSATVGPPECYQAGMGTASTNPLLTKRQAPTAASSEDCLFLECVVDLMYIV